MTHITKEPIWLRTLFVDLRKTQTHSTIIYCDNQSAIALTLNPKYNAPTKHIEIYYHFIQEKVAFKKVLLQYFPTKEMVFDLFAIGLPKEKHHCCHATTRIEENLKSSLQERIIPN